jgi:hypothetical protein
MYTSREPPARAVPDVLTPGSIIAARIAASLLSGYPNTNCNDGPYGSDSNISGQTAALTVLSSLERDALADQQRALKNRAALARRGTKRYASAPAAKNDIAAINPAGSGEKSHSARCLAMYATKADAKAKNKYP